GSELILLLKMGLADVSHMVDIKRIPGLEGLEYDTDTKRLRIGPLVTHRTLEKSEVVRNHFPLIVEMEKQLANVRIRNVGTLAGNLSFAEAHADPVTIAAALASVVFPGSGRWWELRCWRNGTMEPAVNCDWCSAASARNLY